MNGKVFALLAALAICLTGCAGEGSGGLAPSGPAGTSPAPESSAPGVEQAELFCRVVEGAETGSLTLAGLEESAGVYHLTLPEELTPQGLVDGAKVSLTFDGAVEETFPAGLGEVYTVSVAREPADDRCGLYLQVLEDLWAGDSALAADISHIGLDLSGVTDLTDSEKAAVTWLFGCAHGLPVLTGTWQELVDQGYIDGEELYWEDGVFFSLSGSAEDTFDGEIWRSGLGAYYVLDCTGERDGTGAWTYTVGSCAIS